MPPHLRLNGIRWGIILVFGMGTLSLIGVLNGLYNLDQFAQAEENLPASFVHSKAARATLYSYVTIVCGCLGLILLLLDWRSKKSR